MGKGNISRPTDAELEVLNVLWKNGPSTVRSVNDELSRNKNIGYTTTLKIMQIMNEKGLVQRDEENRTHIYRAKVSQKDTQQLLLDKFLSAAFGGSASSLVMQALGNKNTSKEELDEIRKLIDEIEKGKS